MNLNLSLVNEEENDDDDEVEYCSDNINSKTCEIIQISDKKCLPKLVIIGTGLSASDINDIPVDESINYLSQLVLPENIEDLRVRSENFKFQEKYRQNSTSKLMNKHIWKTFDENSIEINEDNKNENVKNKIQDFFGQKDENIEEINFISNQYDDENDNENENELLDNEHMNNFFDAILFNNPINEDDNSDTTSSEENFELTRVKNRSSKSLSSSQNQQSLRQISHNTSFNRPSFYQQSSFNRQQSFNRQTSFKNQKSFNRQSFQRQPSYKEQSPSIQRPVVMSKLKKYKSEKSFFANGNDVIEEMKEVVHEYK